MGPSLLLISGVDTVVTGAHQQRGVGGLFSCSDILRLWSKFVKGIIQWQKGQVRLRFIFLLKGHQVEHLDRGVTFISKMKRPGQNLALTVLL